MHKPIAVLWLWTALAIPSWPVVARFAGAGGVIVYSVLVAVALMVAPRLFARMPRRGLAALSGATWLAIVVLFAVAYPRVNVHTPGAGSDDDDAHDVGVSAMLHGESPYSHRTYLDNALHQLPGSYVLAAPFAILGASALQNLVCLPAFFGLIRRRTRDPRTPLFLAWMALLLSPAIAFQVATGSSYSWNTIWVLLGVWWIATRPRSVLAAVFCGIAICSRPNFFFLLPLAFGWLAREAGVRIATRAMAIVVTTAAALAIPFYVMSLQFGPLEGLARLTQFDDVVPGAGIGIALLMIAVTIALSLMRSDRDGLFLKCAIVQAIPVVAGMLLFLMTADPGGGIAFAAYGSFAAWFALMGAAGRVESWLAGDAGVSIS